MADLVSLQVGGVLEPVTLRTRRRCESALAGAVAGGGSAESGRWGGGGGVARGQRSSGWGAWLTSSPLPKMPSEPFTSEPVTLSMWLCPKSWW